MRASLLSQAFSAVSLCFPPASRYALKNGADTAPGSTSCTSFLVSLFRTSPCLVQSDSRTSLSRSCDVLDSYLGSGKISSLSVTRFSFYATHSADMRCNCRLDPFRPDLAHFITIMICVFPIRMNSGRHGGTLPSQ